MRATMVYSKSPEASAKHIIDFGIMNNTMANYDLLDFEREDYLKSLIEAGSKGVVKVSNLTNGLQFFIIKGGAEGFLDRSYDGQDASHFLVSGGVTTSGQPGTDMIFDDTCLLAVFDHLGNRINSAMLRRPISITNPNIWTEHTADAVFAAWDHRPVSLYHNTNFDVKYFGLEVDDSQGYYSSGKVRIDIHKEEATNGCIFILETGTPDYPDDTLPAAAKTAALDKLSQFEPQVIKDVQKAIHASTKYNIGTMHIIKLK